MKAKEMNFGAGNLQKTRSYKGVYRPLLSVAFLVALMMFGTQPAYAHCDSYDGPVIKDARQALATNNPKLVVKWINADQEKEVLELFTKTYNLKKGDKEVYNILEKYFLETLVRLHRETEGAPYTGLKDAGTTKPIVQLTDMSIEKENLSAMTDKLNAFMAQVIKEKYDKVVKLEKTKNENPEKGREFVKAYVDYTHTVEALHDIMEHTGGHKH